MCLAAQVAYVADTRSGDLANVELARHHEFALTAPNLSEGVHSRSPSDTTDTAIGAAENVEYPHGMQYLKVAIGTNRPHKSARSRWLS